MASHDAAASFAIGMARHVPRCIRHQGYATKNYFDLWLRMLAPSFELLSQYRKGGITFRQFAARHRSEMSRPEPRQVIDVVTMLSRHLSISIGLSCRARTTRGRSGAGLRALFHDEDAGPRARALSLPHDHHGARRHARRGEQRRARCDVSLHAAAGEEAARMNERSPTVFVVDDDAAVRKAVARLPHSVRIEAAVFASPVEFLAAYDPDIPGCLLLDLEMPDLNGLELQQALTERGGALPIIFLSAHGDVPLSVQAMKAGASDFLTKPVRDQVLRAALRAAFEKDRVARLVRAELTGIEARLATLTPREHEVLERVIAGQLNKQIAGDLGTGEHSIKVHRARVMEKMKVESLAELVRLVERARAPRR